MFPSHTTAQDSMLPSNNTFVLQKLLFSCISAFSQPMVIGSLVINSGQWYMMVVLYYIIIYMQKHIENM